MSRTLMALSLVLAALLVPLPPPAAEAAGTAGGNPVDRPPPPALRDAPVVDMSPRAAEEARFVRDTGLDGEGREYERVDVGDAFTVYFHERRVGDAIVEKDYIIHQFDARTGEFLATKSRWRDDVPATLSEGLLDEAAAAMLVPGTPIAATLYILSSVSDVHPLDPTPTNPCWVFWCRLDAKGEVSGDREGRTPTGALVVPIVDAVDGRLLGYGIPPPSPGFSLTGPIEFSPCSSSWSSWAQNAHSWFETMGYATDYVHWPEESDIRDHVASDETAVFYEIAHGDEVEFDSGCIGGISAETTYWNEIAAWISDYEKFPFAFIASCYGLCSVEHGSFSYAFRKGEKSGTTTVGYCGMSDAVCSMCWGYSLSWQNAFFSYANEGYAVGEAFDMALADYPSCAAPNCIRSIGGWSRALVPPIARAPQARLVPDEYATIQAAVGASVRGDVIMVAEGTYFENVVVGGYTELYGGYDSTFAERNPAAHPTVIDAGGVGEGIRVESGDHVVIDGFSVRNATSPYQGINLVSSEARIVNCDVSDCWVGIRMSGGTGTHTEGNPTIEWCDVHDNETRGVEIATTPQDSVIVRWTMLRDNGSEGLYSNSASVGVRNCSVVGNESTGAHVAESDVTFWNCIVASNGDFGLSCDMSTAAVLYCDVWGNVAGDYNSCSAGDGCISEDPVFCDPSAGDYSLHGASPALGGGEYGANMGALGIGCPAGPQNLAVTQDGASLSLTWSLPPWARADVDHYVIYRDTTRVPTTPIATVGASETTFVDVTIPPCIEHRYAVTAVDTDTLEGAPSNLTEGEICYAGPTGLAVAFDDWNELTWTAAAGFVDHYVVRRAVESAEPESLDSVPGSETSYSDTALGACPRNNYVYEVSPVYDTGWRGVASDREVSDPVPAAPAGLMAEWVGNDVHLSWSPNCEDDFRQYWVYRDTMPLSPPPRHDFWIGATTDTTYVDEGLNADWSYFYRLVASDALPQRSVYSLTAYVGNPEVRLVPSQYGTIQAAINAASALDTVLVAAGTYGENITLKDGVVVVSSDGRATTTIQSSTTPVVGAVGLSDLSVFEGFTVDGLGSASSGLDGWDTYVRLVDCAFQNCTSGASFQFGGQATVTGCTFTANQNGVSVADSSRPFLSSNTFDANTFGGVSANGDPGPDVGRTLADANDFINRGLFHIVNTGQATVDAGHNWWDDICPDAGWFFGAVDYTPWTDESHSGSYTECTGIPDEEMTERPYVSYNYPNPFNPSTAIRYSVPSPGGAVRLTVYDLTGRQVRELVSEHKRPGDYLAVWYGRNDRGEELGSGVYFYRLEISDYRFERKIVMLK